MNKTSVILIFLFFCTTLTAQKNYDIGLNLSSVAFQQGKTPIENDHFAIKTSIELFDIHSDGRYKLLIQDQFFAELGSPIFSPIPKTTHNTNVWHQTALLLGKVGYHILKDKIQYR